MLPSLTQAPVLEGGRGDRSSRECGLLCAPSFYCGVWLLQVVAQSWWRGQHQAGFINRCLASGGGTVPRLCKQPGAMSVSERGMGFGSACSGVSWRRVSITRVPTTALGERLRLGGVVCIAGLLLSPQPQGQLLQREGQAGVHLEAGSHLLRSIMASGKERGTYREREPLNSSLRRTLPGPEGRAEGAAPAARPGVRALGALRAPTLAAPGGPLTQPRS